jgi:hypothetical protein
MLAARIKHAQTIGQERFPAAKRMPFQRFMQNYLIRRICAGLEVRGQPVALTLRAAPWHNRELTPP